MHVVCRRLDHRMPRAARVHRYVGRRRSGIRWLHAKCDRMGRARIRVAPLHCFSRMDHCLALDKAHDYEVLPSSGSSQKLARAGNHVVFTTVTMMAFMAVAVASGPLALRKQPLGLVLGLVVIKFLIVGKRLG